MVCYVKRYLLGSDDLVFFCLLKNQVILLSTPLSFKFMRSVSLSRPLFRGYSIPIFQWIECFIVWFSNCLAFDSPQPLNTHAFVLLLKLHFAEVENKICLIRESLVISLILSCQITLTVCGWPIHISLNLSIVCVIEYIRWFIL